MARKKILWLCSWYPSRAEPFNGDFVQRHAKAASKFNDIHVIHVYATNEKKPGIMEELLNPGPGLTEQIIYYHYSPSFLRRLISHVKMIGLYKKAIRHYIQKHGKPDLLHVHVPLKAGLAGTWAKKKYNIPLVISEHWGIYNKVVKDNYETRNGWFKSMSKKVFFTADQVTSVSQFLINCLQDYFRLGSKRVIPNCVDTGQFYYKAGSIERFRFIHVSNMVPLKNVEGILRVFKEVSNPGNVELVMVGNLDNKMFNYAKQLGIPASAIHFRGEVSYEQVAREMQSAHCLVMFSDIENSPCVIGEALCCGLPVIASPVGGIPELISDQQGMLIEPRNEQELKFAMQRMRDEYSKYDRLQISNEAARKFSYEEIGRRFDELYEDVKRET